MNSEERAALNQQELQQMDAIENEVQSDADTENHGVSAAEVDQDDKSLGNTLTEAQPLNKHGNDLQGSSFAVGTPSQYTANGTTKMANHMQRSISEERKEVVHTRSEPQMLDSEQGLQQPQYANTGQINKQPGHLSMHFVPEMTQESMQEEPDMPEFLPTEQ